MNDIAKIAIGNFAEMADKEEAKYFFVTDTAEKESAIRAADYDYVADIGEDLQGFFDYMQSQGYWIRCTGKKIIFCIEGLPKGKLRELAGGWTDRIVDGYKIFHNEEYLTNKDKSADLKKKIENFIEEKITGKHKEKPKPEGAQTYITSHMVEDIKNYKPDENMRTGFKELDEKLKGLRSGLYCLIAPTSRGKTTLALQIADNLAMHGKHVLYFAMEQGKLELFAKSIARTCCLKNSATAPASIDIMDGKLSDAVIEAANEYAEAVGDRMNIIEGIFSQDTDSITGIIEEYMAANECRPIVFIDYLQLIQCPEDNKRHDRRETIDLAVAELKRMSHRLHLTIILISSMSRAGYNSEISLDSAKESGGIEFTCDVVLGLQLEAATKDTGSKDDVIKTAMKENPRKMVISILKNRYGMTGDNVYLDYYSKNDLFKESKAPCDRPSEKRIRY